MSHSSTQCNANGCALYFESNLRLTCTNEFVSASIGLGWGGVRCRSSFQIIIHIIMFIGTVLAQPTFNDATINEGEMLSITCVTGNIRDITDFQVLDAIVYLSD